MKMHYRIIDCRWMLALLFLMGLGQLQAAEPFVDRSYDATARVAVISAFEPELQRLRSKAEIAQTKVINGRSYYVGKLEGNNVVLLLSGVSMVNAAMATQTLLDHFNVKEIVFSGIAGGVNPGLHVGDVTVPAAWGQYQEQAFARAVETGWDTGRQGAEFGNYGMMFPHSVSVVNDDTHPDKSERRFWFPVDQKSLDIAKKLIGKVTLNKCAAADKCLTTAPAIVVGGKGVSGPTFVDNAEYRSWVWTTFSADALDMETASVAAVAYTNHTPLIAFRSLSDLAGGGPGKNESGTFFKLAADNSAEVVLAFLHEFADTSVIENQK